MTTDTPQRPTNISWCSKNRDFMSWEKCNLTIEDCRNFYFASHQAWAHYGEKDIFVRGYDVQEILRKTDGGWDFADFGRGLPLDYLQTAAEHIAKKLNLPEITIIKRIARLEKKSQRRLNCWMTQNCSIG